MLYQITAVVVTLIDLIVNVYILSDMMCLPKPKCALNFKMVSGVPGLGIVADDEDWSDKGVLEEFYLNLKKELSLSLAKQLPFRLDSGRRKPIYFDSDEEALAMVRKHFPGKDRCDTIS